MNKGERALKRCFDCKLFGPYLKDCEQCKINDCFHYEAEIKEYKEIISLLELNIIKLKHGENIVKIGEKYHWKGDSSYTERKIGYIEKLVFKRQSKCSKCGHLTRIYYHFNLQYLVEFTRCFKCLIKLNKKKRW